MDNTQSLINMMNAKETMANKALVDIVQNGADPRKYLAKNPQEAAAGLLDTATMGKIMQKVDQIRSQAHSGQVPSLAAYGAQ